MSDRFWRWLVRKLRPALVHAQANGQLFDSRQPIAPHPPPAPAVPPDPEPASPTPTTEEDLRRLMGLALSTPTPPAIMAFVAFASRMKRLGAYNIMMAYTQRPGAVAIASREDWAAIGQAVRPDAIPILILHPRGPIRQVFELMDTVPLQDRDPRADVFAATGPFDEKRLGRLIAALAKPTKRALTVEVALEDYGAGLAGRITAFGFARPHAADALLLGAPDAASAIRPASGRACWRVKLNRRLTPAERFATLLHELGHLFCGHLGGFDMENPDADEYGWPDRSSLPHAAREIEAELVAWHICDREGLVTGSPLYLNSYMDAAGEAVARVDLDRVIRAIARVRAYLGDPKVAVR